MLDEEMDDIIKQAAEQHHPSYDNKAWDKMEQMLDKHLPQKKDRRGFIFFLLLGLLIGGGLLVGGYYFMGKKRATVASVDTKKEAGKAPAPQSIVPNNNSTADRNAPTSITVNDNSNTITGSVPDQNSNTINGSEQNRNNNAARGSEQQHAGAFVVGRGAAKTRINITPGSTVTDEATVTNGSSITNNQQEKGSFTSDITKVIAPGADKNKTTTEIKENAVENKPDVQSTLKKTAGADIIKEIPKEKSVETVSNKTSTSTEKKRSKQSIAGNFGFNFSVGPDISYVELKKPGKISLTYGVGLSYTFLKKLTLQSGFYVSRKLYSADSADYHAPAAFWNTYPNMDKTVVANCKVYEVPVNLLYNFKQRGKHNLYAGAGLSTYFMKHEGYDYSYKYAGMVIPKSISLDSKNQHNFSVLTLTGGYKYDLSPRISFSAEPYVKLPLNGIGFGRVELKSGGLLFNATMKPFAKRNKK